MLSFLRLRTSRRSCLTVLTLTGIVLIGGLTAGAGVANASLPLTPQQSRCHGPRHLRTDNRVCLIANIRGIEINQLGPNGYIGKSTVTNASGVKATRQVVFRFYAHTGTGVVSYNRLQILRHGFTVFPHSALVVRWYASSHASVSAGHTQCN